MDQNMHSFAARLEALAAEIRAVAVAAAQPPPPRKLLLSIREAAELAGASEWAIRQMLERGQLPEQRLGSRRLIPREAIEALAHTPKAS